MRMLLNVGAVYRPEADEVWVEFASTENDGTTVTAADLLTLTLRHRTRDLIGAATLHPLTQVQIPLQYIQADKSYTARFRHPRRRQELVLDVEAKYGVLTFTKSVEVGQGAVPQQQMELPQNPQYEHDRYRQPLDQGQGPDELLEPLEVVLSSEIEQYAQIFDFTTGQPPETFQTLVYAGGGNRLLLSSRTAAFERQPLDRAPWQQYAYLFLEQASQNLIPNPFFTTLTNGSPTGFEVDPGGAILTQTVALDPKTSPDAKIWALRFRQTNVVSAFNRAVVQVMQNVPVVAGTTYTFSCYARVRALTAGSAASKLFLVMRWYNGSSFVSESTLELPSAQFVSIDLASLTAQAPPSANRVVPSVQVGSIDAGDDIELALLGPQVEAGSFPTTRTEGARLADSVTLPPYNPENQKFRIELIPGFGSADVLTSLPLTSGVVVLSFEPGGFVKADLVGQGSVQAPLVFSAGDVLDLTVAHQQDGKIRLWKSGVLLAEQPLSSFTAPVGVLALQGTGAEVVRLTLFSRI
jgi:hypothetical protein